MQENSNVVTRIERGSVSRQVFRREVREFLKKQQTVPYAASRGPNRAARRREARRLRLGAKAAAKKQAVKLSRDIAKAVQPFRSSQVRGQVRGQRRLGAGRNV
jgi:hypothetical protein